MLKPAGANTPEEYIEQIESENGEYIAEKHKSELPKASVGKSCIRFKRLSDIELKVLETLVKLGAKIMATSASA